MKFNSMNSKTIAVRFVAFIIAIVLMHLGAIESLPAESRIVNGDLVMENDPIIDFMVSIMICFPNKPISCGGTLINRFEILTAAHCFVEYLEATEKPNTWAVIRSVEKLNVFTHQRIETARLHENFNSNSSARRFDIAIVTLTEEIPSNFEIHPVRLNSDLKLPLVGEVFVYGWGQTDTMALTSTDKLLQAKLALHSIEFCRTLALSSGLYSVETVNELGHDPSGICFYDPTNMKGHGIASFIGMNGKIPCNGDSGGPVLMKKKSKSGKEYLLQVGIITHSAAEYIPHPEDSSIEITTCTLNVAFGINVGHFYEWIQDNSNHKDKILSNIE